MVRYLVHKPYLAWTFPAGAKLEYFDVCADSDWAAKETERTSLCSKRVQRRKASSGEAELHAANSNSSMRYPTAAIPQGNRSPTSVACTWRDSAAARGMMTRRGSGRAKHLDIKALWCQEAMEMEHFRLMKVDSENNPADIGTKTLSADRIVHLLRLLRMDAA